MICLKSIHKQNVLGNLKYFLDVTCYHSNYDFRLHFVYFLCTQLFE